MAGLAALALAAGACHLRPHVAAGPAAMSRADVAFLDSLEHASFQWFWDLADPRTSLTPDRAPTRSFASVGAEGFALSAYAVGAERGWVTRAEAAARVRQSLEFFWRSPQHARPAGATGYKGFYYHFLVPETGERFETVELSSVDTALLLAGVLFCQSYFDRSGEDEARIRALADSLYGRVDWTWLQVRGPKLALGWTPERGHLPYDWGGYNEAMLLHLLALGSPTHPVSPDVWAHWTSGYRWGAFHGQQYLGFAPLFGHQYSHCWIDFRGIQDAWMRGKQSDYFENSRRATLAQRAYAVANPREFRGYGPRLWGLTACDGPFDGEADIDGRKRTFRTYAARGACFTETVDDGTIAPTAVASSLPFAPKLCVDALRAMKADWGAFAWNRYGFVDALNPTLTEPRKVQHGRIVPGVGWFDTDQLGIDQGPIVLMIENTRSGLVWKTLQRNPHVVRGLRRAGFEGGWLDRAPATR